jgi:hypothetical protein
MAAAACCLVLAAGCRQLKDKDSRPTGTDHPGGEDQVTTPVATPAPTPTPEESVTTRTVEAVDNASTEPQRGKVRILWTTESSEGIYGFNVYRGKMPMGPWTRVNKAPILAAEGGTTNKPHDYVVIDDAPELHVGDVHYYWLEEVKSDGNKAPAWWPPKSVKIRTPFDEEFPPIPQ